MLSFNPDLHYEKLHVRMNLGSGNKPKKSNVSELTEILPEVS